MTRRTAKTAPPRRTRLTRRQAQIVALVLQERSAKQIAAELRLSIATVRMHLRLLYLKLDVHGQVGLVMWAFRSGYVQSDV